ncbi:Ig domain protein, group 2 domain protein [Fimbriimonas ginsengisoli Gsoil 348]|uniref:Ig domain protein, group 2 domain protein n=1 Tax=Fimbriimonas ginsengisoli Gsoil 348 TaxID=661478 RepID=A0A068NPU2_FIMGI|nr:Ig domain protein, group 2 domain protein [Fimbriimonas ginsengisoli Gsoil 348]
MTGLASAQSATVILQHAAANGGDVQVKVDRAADPAAYTATYSVGHAILTSVTSLTATFYSLPAEAGIVVGTATATVNVNNGSLDLATVNVVATVKSVVVIDPGHLVAGTGPVQLLASAKDANGAAVAVTPGSIKWALASGANSLTLSADGIATPVAAGTAAVTATVDGIQSAQALVTIDPATISSPVFQITWPDRTRTSLAHNLSSALSASVTFNNADSSGADVVVKVDRDPTKLASYTGTYSVGRAVLKDVSSLTATFYAQAGQQGAAVGTATATVAANQSNLDIASIVLVGKISTVAVVAPPTLTVGQASGMQLEAATKDASNATVAVSAGSFKWNVVTGGDNLTVTADGIATPINAGMATVTATVDGITSAAQTVTIQPAAGNQTAIQLPVNDIAFDSVSGKIWATVQSTGGIYANSVVAIDPATGAIGTKINMGAEPNRLAITDDGQFAYVSVPQDGSIRRANLTTATVGPTFADNIGGVIDLESVPGQPHAYVAVTDPLFGVNTSVWDDGVRRQGTGAGGYAIKFAGNSSLMYGDGHNSLFADTLNATAITWTEQTALDVAGLVWSKGLLYTDPGTVIDPVNKTLVQTLPATDFLVDRGVAVSESDNRIYYVTWDSSHNKRILTFDQTTYAEKPVYDTGAIPGGALDLTACGNHTVAFYNFGSGVTRELIIVRNLP